MRASRLLSIIVSIVMCITCLTYTAVAEPTIDEYYEYKTTATMTSLTDSPITFDVPVTIKLSKDRQRFEIYLDQDIDLYFDSKFTNILDDYFYILGFSSIHRFYDYRYDSTDLTLDYFVFLPEVAFIENKYNYITVYNYDRLENKIINAGTKVKEGTLLVKGYLYPQFRKYREGAYEKTAELYIKGYDDLNEDENDLSVEVIRLNRELDSYKLLDSDCDGMLTVNDAQMILNYYGEYMSGNVSGKVEDYQKFIENFKETS